MLTGEQIRAARALLRWEQRQLSEAAEVSLETVKRLEGMTGMVSANTATVDKIKRALEAAGIQFVFEDTGGEGVRFRLPRDQREA